MQTARVWLSGFLLLGMVLGLLGSLVVAWQYQIDVDPALIGLHFLCLNCGYILAAVITPGFLRRLSSKAATLVACLLCCGSLLALAAAAPPTPMVIRLLFLATLGFSAGGLATVLIDASKAYRELHLSTGIGRPGIFFGSGCLLATVTTAIFYQTRYLQLETAFLALIPAAYFLAYYLQANDSGVLRPPDPAEEMFNKNLHASGSIATVFLRLLLFFQFGNEWALAGWLPLFLIHRLGSSPVLAIDVLALYFLALMLGRFIAQKLLSRTNHRRLLIGSVALSICGLVLLSFTNSLLAAAFAAVVIGSSFAPIHPLVAERFDYGFSFHPGFYSSAISFAFTGAMSAPWLLGIATASLGMRYAMLLPALGSIAVLLLSLLPMLGAHLMNARTPASVQARSAKAGSGH